MQLTNDDFADWDGLTPAIREGKLQLPLYHGTSSHWIDSIRMFGLGGQFPFAIDEALELLQRLYERVPEEHRDITTPHMLDQRSDHMNWQHGQVYLSSSRAHASIYATSNELGSELLTICGRYSKVARPAFQLPDWFTTISEARGEPIVLKISAVPVDLLQTEAGCDAYSVMEELERERVAAHEAFSKIELARGALRAGTADGDAIWLVMENKGKQRSPYVLEQLALYWHQKTFRLRPGSVISFDDITPVEVLR